MLRSRKLLGSLVVALSMIVTSQALAAKAAPKSVVISKDAVQWSEAGIPGVMTAQVHGDMKKGQSHFYLKYPAGFVAPMHRHTADHYVTVVTGTLVLIVDGKEHVLGPGSYFALTGKMSHSARVEGSEDAVMFVDARGPWDVVPEATGK